MATGVKCDHVGGRYADGRCKECKAASNRKWRLSHLPQVRAAKRRYWSENKEKSRAATRNWTARNKTRILANQRKRTGVPEPTRPKPNRCECCPRSNVPLRADHDHVTGKFRGWICNRCNLGIGHLGDDRTGCLRAVAYLSRAL